MFAIPLLLTLAAAQPVHPVDSTVGRQGAACGR